MIKWLKKLFRKRAHEWTEPLIVSGYGYTEYEIRFCKRCLKCEGKLTKQLW